MTRLHIFDMDGTLLEGSACLEISEYLGVLDEVNIIEEAWQRGEVDHVSFYEMCLPLWKGLTEEGMDELFFASPWYDGIESVWSDIAARGEHSAVVTLSPQFFAERLLQWGLGSAHGADVRADVALDPHLVMTPEMKLSVAKDLMKRYGVTEDECVAYGDSSSDIPLFERLSYTVAINGNEAIRGMASVSYEGTDLREAYHAGRSLFEEDSQSRLERSSGP